MTLQGDYRGSQPDAVRGLSFIFWILMNVSCGLFVLAGVAIPDEPLICCAHFVFYSFELLLERGVK